MPEQHAQSDTPQFEALQALEPSRALKRRVLESIAARPAPTRSSTRTRQWLGMGIAWSVGLSIFFYLGGIRVTERPLPLIVGTALGTALLAASAAWIALTRGRSSLGRPLRLALPIVLSALPLIVVWKIAFSSQFPRALVEWPTRPGFRCLGVTLAVAAVPFAGFMYLWRNTEARHPISTGLLGAYSVGLLATFLTDLWCPVAYPPHLLLGHALPVAILTALGALLGRRLIGIKRL